MPNAQWTAYLGAKFLNVMTAESLPAIEAARGKVGSSRFRALECSKGNSRGRLTQIKSAFLLSQSPALYCQPRRPKGLPCVSAKMPAVRMPTFTASGNEQVHRKRRSECIDNSWAYL